LEHRLSEFKARVESLEVIRRKLRDMSAHFVGAFHQVDTFFNVPKGRLKLRSVEGKEKGTLIYYEREDIRGSKRSKALIIEVSRPDLFRSFFQQVLGEKVVIDKRREIYVHKGTQIHLDTVENLGAFVEFERKSVEFTKDSKIFENLAKKLEIKNEDRLESSYSDIALKNRNRY
jgi:adenylate cyclase class 2